MRFCDIGSRFGVTPPVIVAVGLALFPVSASTQAQGPTHPLDGLFATEIETVAEVLREAGRVNDETRLHIVSLHEPPKRDVLTWELGEPFGREAFVVVKQGAQTFEAIVDVVRGDVTSWQEIQGVEPNLSEEDMVQGGESIKSHPDWQAAMRRRGITDFEPYLCVAVSPGYYGLDEETGRRVGKAWCYDLSTGASNFWARPVEGLTTLIDLNTYEVIRVIDTGPVPVPTAGADYDEASVGRLRDVPTSIAVDRPDGPAFRLSGHQVTWQKWNFHFRIDPRVGLIVSRVGYGAGDAVRSILYQGSLAELFVPYMDPDPGWYFRTYLDAGEFLVGYNVAPLEPGVDCPRHAHYFDAVFADGRGVPRPKPRAACVFERYAGDVAWRHFDFVTGDTETRQKRDLVLRMIATIGNYDYTFDWTFQQDGTIRVGVGASGIEQVKAVASRAANDAGGAEDARYGRFVSEHTVAVNHDHFFNFRLDFDVDGVANSLLLEELKTVPLSDEHARKSVWVLDPEIVTAEKAGRRRIDLARPTLWRVINPDVLGPLGYPVSYEIKPGTNARSLMVADDFPQQRAGFIDYHLWVTPYRADERYAAGAYPVQSHGGDGLPGWTSANRPVERTDIVVWYTLGLHHVVRAEDWPVLPTNWQSFELRPFDFFARNPALDLPRTR